MPALRGHRLRAIRVRDEPEDNDSSAYASASSVVVDGDSAAASSSTSAPESGTKPRAPPIKLSAPAIIGIACVGLIIIGLGLLFWRWRARKREIARMNQQFRVPYEKYGMGKGVESSNSNSSSGSGGKSSKSDPYGSFFEVETEKPKKALLNFRRSSASNNFGARPQATRQQQRPPYHHHQHSGQQQGGHKLPKVSPRDSGRPMQSASSTVPPAATQYNPPGITARMSEWRSSFSFASKRSGEEKKTLQVQQLPSIKAKGISAPLIVANGGAEPWTPPPVASSSTAGFGFNVLPPSPPPPAPRTPPPPPAQISGVPAASSQPPKQKFRQPQPRSPPATPGTSQKQIGVNPPDSLSAGVSRDSTNTALLSSDGSLYSRNSFSSSNQDHLQPLPPYSETALPPGMFVTGTGTTVAINSANSELLPQLHGSAKGPSSSRTNGYDGDMVIVRPGSPSNLHTNINSSTAHQCLPRLMTVVAPFTPTLEDELPLKVGDAVRVIEEYRDAWCLVQLVGRIDSPRGVVPCVCLQERKRIVPVPVNVGGPRNQSSLNNLNQWR